MEFDWDNISIGEPGLNTSGSYFCELEEQEKAIRDLQKLLYVLGTIYLCFQLLLLISSGHQDGERSWRGAGLCCVVQLVGA